VSGGRALVGLRGAEVAAEAMGDAQVIAQRVRAEPNERRLQALGMA
jgi:hypothetical protein